MDDSELREFGEHVERAGFLILGGFHPGHDDVCPTGPDGERAATLILVGNAGAALWHAFRAAPEAGDGLRDPLDRYTRRALHPLAERFALSVAFVFERPYWPFQRWAETIGGFSPSPMGVLAHARFGPWAGLRAAFLSPRRLELPRRDDRPGPCPTCTEAPCIAACPAAALSRTGYDVARCLAHLEQTPRAACLAGCRARVSCPYGTRVRHAEDQARFHMNAFTRWRDWT